MGTIASEFVYKAFQLARDGNHQGAQVLLRQSRLDSFGKGLLAHLEHFGQLRLDSDVFSDPTAFAIWGKTRFVQREEQFWLDEIVTCISASELTISPTNPLIIDIGCGNGVFLCKLVNRLSKVFHFSSVTLVLLDASEKMLQEALSHCGKALDVRCKCITVCRKVQDLKANDVQQFQSLKPWFVSSFCALHHLNETEKRDFFRAWSQVGSNMFIGEQEGAHGSPTSEAFDLFCSVSKFYGFLFDQVRSTEISEDEQQVCIQQFLLAEAIRILTNDYPRRGDYHTSVTEWTNAATSAHFKVAGIQSTKLMEGEFVSFLLWLRSGYVLRSLHEGPQQANRVG